MPFVDTGNKTTTNGEIQEVRTKGDSTTFPLYC